VSKSALSCLLDKAITVELELGQSTSLFWIDVNVEYTLAIFFKSFDYSIYKQGFIRALPKFNLRKHISSWKLTSQVSANSKSYFSRHNGLLHDGLIFLTLHIVHPVQPIYNEYTNTDRICSVYTTPSNIASVSTGFKMFTRSFGRSRYMFPNIVPYAYEATANSAIVSVLSVYSLLFQHPNPHYNTYQLVRKVFNNDRGVVPSSTTIWISWGISRI
jgi:hypothetical protein